MKEIEKEKFMDLTKAELQKVAEKFGTEVRPTTSKKDIVEALDADGADWKTYEAFFAPKPEPEDLPDPEGELVFEGGLFDEEPVTTTAKRPVVRELPPEPEAAPTLVKMIRKNFTYEVRGYKFTREHPYALVKDEDADYLIETGGFRIASGKEARDFYG